MKNILKFLFILFTLVTFMHAVTLTDDFESSKNGWTDIGTDLLDVDAPVNSRVLSTFDDNVWKSKTYFFNDSNLAGLPVTIEFDMWAVGGWESGSTSTDYFHVRANSVNLIDGETIPNADGSSSPVYQHFSLTGTLNSSGNLVLDIKANVTGGSEGIYLDNFVISTPNNTPVAEYRLDECSWSGVSGEVINTSGIPHGTSVGGVDTSMLNRKLCNNGYFDGVDDYVTMGDAFNTIFGTGNDQFTITAWINPSALNSAASNHGTANTFIAKASDSDNDNFEVGITPGGKIHVYLDTNGGNTQRDFGSGITTNNWHFVAITYNGSEITVTINNATFTQDPWGGDLKQANGSPFTLGTTLHSDTSYNGHLDEVKIFDSALPQSAINTIYDNENGGTRFDGSPSSCPSCSTLNPIANDKFFTTAINTSITDNLMTNGGTPDSDPEGDTITTTKLTDPVNGAVNVLSDGTFTYNPDTGTTGLDTFDYLLTDINGYTATATVRINVQALPTSDVIARDDILYMPKNTVLTAFLFANDEGDQIRLNSNPSFFTANGEVEITPLGTLTYTPNPDFFGVDSFTYNIIDINGVVSVPDANVTIYISNDTNFTDGFQPFHIVNPVSTRNVNGNFATAGNTVLCLTDRTDQYATGNHPDDQCKDAGASLDTSNNFIAKYIDIDENLGEGRGTWNSSSSNIILPDTFDEKLRGRGILWAGLYWQGRISAEDNHPMHYGMEDGSGGFNWVEVGEGSTTTMPNMTTVGANKLKLDINGEGYNDVQAIELITYSSSNGATYSAYADVTYLLRNTTTSLDIGTHTFTVANLTTNEGRENSPGCFGGWSLLVIYAEDSASGDLRNISSYHGFVSMSDNPPPIHIEGFKLPLEGDVDSQATVFSGEGEYLYGRRPGSNNFDWMKISRFQNTGYDYMPGPIAGDHIGNRDNMFDARLTGINRTNVAGHYNNLQVNNVGVDIDVFNVSSVMENYRDLDSDINEVFLEVDSNNDYVTPSMVTFSTQLYKPNVCYDFASDINGFALPTITQDINTTANIGDEIGVTVAITSLESDFDLQNSAVSIRLDQVDGHLALDTSRAFYSPVNSNVLLDTSFTAASTNNRPEIAIGKNRNEAIGGLIQSYEQYFSKFYFDVTDTNASRVFTDFDIELTTSIDFGSGPVTQVLPVRRCDQNLTYNPLWAAFNVERHATANPSIGDDTDRYSLYTQIAGKDFDYSVVSYNPTTGFSTEIAITDITVDVELINADSFDDNGSALKCSNPSFDIIHGGFGNSRFVTFTNKSRVPITDALDFSNTDASRNSIFRTWILVDENSTIIPHTASRTDGHLFRDIYTTNYASIDATDRCGTGICIGATSGDPSCYNCLRLNFAKAICSRDNFAIRPASYRVTLADAGPLGDEATPLDVVQNSTGTTPAKTGSLAAEYPYLLEGFAVDNSGIMVNGYTRISSQFTTNTYAQGAPQLTDNTLDMALMRFNDDDPTHLTACNDTDHNTYNISFDRGNIVDYNLSGRNAGNYDFLIKDNGWTKVDQAANNPNKTLFNSNCGTLGGRLLAGCNDCGIGSGAITLNLADKHGCSTLSDLDNSTYEELELTFNPYQFDLSGLNFVRRPTGGTTDGMLYFSDLDSSLAMSIGFSGIIAAQGYSNTNLSNFVTGCAAQNIVLDTNKTTAPGDVTDSSDNNISFQQVLVDVTGTTSPVILDNNSLTVDALNFAQLDNGIATNLDIHYNYKKPLGLPMNPADVNITLLTATSPNASSNANMDTDYIPDGNVTGAQRRFYYARTVPGQAQYETKEDFQITSLLVQIYCSDPANVLCAAMGLGGVSYPIVPNDSEWYSANAHDPADGSIIDIQVVSGPGSITPSGALPFITGKRTDLRVDYSGGGRPETNDINATVSPWLNYLNNTVSYRVIFTSDGNWAGVGETGFVLDTLPKDEPNNRISW